MSMTVGEYNEFAEKLAAFMAAKPKCPTCGVECTEDLASKSVHCHVCVRTWTKMQLLQEAAGRRRLAALAAASAEADRPTVVLIPPIGGA